MATLIFFLMTAARGSSGRGPRGEVQIVAAPPALGHETSLVILSFFPAGKFHPKAGRRPRMGRTPRAVELLRSQACAGPDAPPPSAKCPRDHASSRPVLPNPRRPSQGRVADRDLQRLRPRPGGRPSSATSMRTPAGRSTLMERSRRQSPPSWLAHWDGDGIIARIERPQHRPRDPRLEAPGGRRQCRAVTWPALALGGNRRPRDRRLAAEHFLERGFQILRLLRRQTSSAGRAAGTRTCDEFRAGRGLSLRRLRAEGRGRRPAGPWPSGAG